MRQYQATCPLPHPWRAWCRRPAGEAVHLALTTAKPKARYAVIKQRFKNWTLPRLLPAKLLDAVMAKQLGFIRS
jgi:hypothetical protein